MSYQSDFNFIIVSELQSFDSCSPGQNGRHFGSWHFQLHFIWLQWWDSDWQQASIGSGNGLSPVRRQAITWTNAGLLMMTQFIDAYMRH